MDSVLAMKAGEADTPLWLNDMLSKFVLKNLCSLKVEQGRSEITNSFLGSHETPLDTGQVLFLQHSC